MFHDSPSYHTPVISCMIVCRSVTYAQKYSKILRKHGYTASMRRLPSHITQTGCGHAVSVRKEQLHSALSLLREYGAEPTRIFCENAYGVFEEMSV